MSSPFSSIEEALEEIRAGRMVIVVDDEDRENEGDFVMAAEKVTPDAINFMAQHGRGLICLPMTGERLDELKIPPMTSVNTSAQQTAFHVSIGAKGRITTGISAADRAATILAAIDPATQPEDISMPGHVFPLRARPGGVLERAGHTEAAVDLARLAGLYPAGVICEILNPDGTMARRPELEKVAERFGLKMITVADLIRYRRRTERLVERVATVSLPTRFGEFVAHGYRSLVDDSTHVALVCGEVAGEKDVLVRVHSECLTGDVFHSLRCDCGAQLEEAMRRIQEEGRGVLLYIVGHEGRGIGLAEKLRAYELQEQGLDTVEANEALGYPADLRDYGIGAQILADLGLTSMRLMTNNPTKIVGLEAYGLTVTEAVPLQVGCTVQNVRYLKAKKDKMSHRLDLPVDLTEGE
ncbi:bifunctional 3,4-dihydroxy-2-butanone-4-phosphate synthase/GTP cyclohydrolase II [Coriobacteriia bacterium Es71-Z0120]|uniref:bifunctional 3,4-dihydroxy-2-butanone-4-phosphate synthase/GTP cyclohydrolase II n=1 Tax=Parvivirga hydrogeniphila TaxID=2939460 RepID=UPI0022608FE8|nr:bifunctional 3,4-dihydroxy-2-butanone-4-phosphate synthase/GTP cyclohydrolase II [Parvivirga hydrogeniphila]MCL4079065.1 bifunctional 3,4-dihydroxy-2-butanone-4-phosphate synthase/GTP cyclohydrolase II [Parvivirga hydrogeniphila]